MGGASGLLICDWEGGLGEVVEDERVRDGVLRMSSLSSVCLRRGMFWERGVWSLDVQDLRLHYLGVSFS